MYDATNDSIASASCSGGLGLFMKHKSHAAIVSPAPGVSGYLCRTSARVCFM